MGEARPWPESGGQLRYSHCGVGSVVRPGPRDLPPPLDFEPVAATCAGACGAGICWGRGRPPRAPHSGPRARRASSSGLAPAVARALCRPRSDVPARPRQLLSLAACFVVSSHPASFLNEKAPIVLKAVQRSQAVSYFPPCVVLAALPHVRPEEIK